jgi:small subunit ribosomal protein S2
MPSKVSMKQLLEMGVHFGHRTQKWNPKMQPYIFTQRNGIHILDLQQTLRNLNQYYDMVRDLVRNGGTVLFVGTKRQAQETIAEEAARCGMPYINTRWLGGTLTNWRTIRSRIEMLKKLEQRRDKGEFELLTKREGMMLGREIDKLQERLGGIRNMKKEPDLIVVVDTFREVTAVKEANSLNIPVLALVDSNSDPDVVDYILPANDDAMRSIKLIISALADAAIEGRQMRGKEDDAVEEDTMTEADFARYDGTEEDEEGGNERYLGKSTLAKLRDTQLFEDEDSDS